MTVALALVFAGGNAAEPSFSAHGTSSDSASAKPRNAAFSVSEEVMLTAG